MESLLTVNEVAKRLNIGRATVYILRKRHPDFPQPISIGPQSPRWLPNELTAWIEAQRSAVAH